MQGNGIYLDGDFKTREEEIGDSETSIFPVGNGESTKVLYDKRVVSLQALGAILRNGCSVSKVAILPDGAFDVGTAYCFCPVCLREMNLSDMRIVSREERVSYSNAARDCSLSAFSEAVFDLSMGRIVPALLNPRDVLSRLHDTCECRGEQHPRLWLAFDEIPSSGELIVADIAEAVKDDRAFAKCPLCGRAFSLEWREGEIFRKQLSVCKRDGVIELKVESNEGALETGVRLDFDRAAVLACRSDGKWHVCNTPEAFARLPQRAGCSFDAASHVCNLLGNASGKAACSHAPKAEVSPLRLALMARFQGYDERFYASACNLFSRESPYDVASALLRLPHRLSKDKSSYIEELAEEAGFPNTKRFRRIAFTNPIVCAIGAHVGGLRVDNPDRLAAFALARGFPVLAFSLWGKGAEMRVISDAAVSGLGESSFVRWACSENATTEVEMLVGSVERAVDDGHYAGSHVDDLAVWIRDSCCAMEGGFAGFVRRSATYVPILLSLSVMGMEKYRESFCYGDEVERRLCIEIDGLTFGPVASLEELIQAAQEMHNCLSGYVDKVVRERYIVIARTRDKRIVAALELDTGFGFVQGFQPFNVPIDFTSALGEVIGRYIEQIGGRT